MAFINYRLPDDIERGARGGPRFNTTVATIFSGHEKRNINWQQARGEWDIGYGLQELFDLDEPSALTSLRAVRDLFYAARGRAHSFKFKDWADYEIGQPGVPQQIAVGDGSRTQFQLVKTYSASGLFLYSKPVHKPIVSTYSVFVNSISTSSYTIDSSTGLLTISPAPENGHPIAVYGEYDVVVRFDSDELVIDMAVFNSGSLPNIKIVEVRES